MVLLVDSAACHYRKTGVARRSTLTPASRSAGDALESDTAHHSEETRIPTDHCRMTVDVVVDTPSVYLTERNRKRRRIDNLLFIQDC